MEFDNMILIGMTFACMVGMAVTMRENRMLKGYVEFYRRQLNSAISRWEECANMLAEESERHGECATKFQELLRAYETVYDILDRHGLLPEELQ